MRTGTVGTSAICAARKRLAPATISKLWSVRGRTSKGERTPWLRMLSANSLRAESSKMWRGLVADSVRTPRGRLRYSVAVFGFMGCSPLSGLGRAGGELSGRREAVRHIKAGVSLLAPVRVQVLRRFPLRG